VDFSFGPLESLANIGCERYHVSAILTKLGVPSRAEAVAMARNPQGKGA
jgi:hypothetical protein